MKNTTTYLVLLLLVISLSSTTCKDAKKNSNQINESLVNVIVPVNLKWSERMLLSEIERVPKASMLDFVKKPRWSYTNGLVLSAAIKVYEASNKQTYYDYIYAYVDEMIDRVEEEGLKLEKSEYQA